jgi:hypothetical protein
MPKKVSQYEAERKDILNKILSIIGIDETIKSFRLEDITEEKEGEIYGLEKEIKKYYKTTGWNCFKQKEMCNRWLSMLRSIIKEYGGEIITKRKSSKKGEVHETIMEYYVIFNTEI